MTNDDTLPGFSADESGIIESILDGKRSAPIYIDDLPDAIVDGKPRFKEGDLIVVEKWLTLNAEPSWLGTRLCRVRRIDPLGSGDVQLHDEDLSQSLHANYITGPKHGWRFKLTIKGLNLHRRSKSEKVKEDIQRRSADADIGSDAHGPERVRQLAEQIGALPVSMLAVGRDIDGDVPKKRIGRPKGVKSRPREVIAAEKKRIREERAAKKAARARNK